MKITKSKLIHSLASCLITLLSAHHAHADDTEILFEASAANELTPNVMFILDNSGSMGSLVTTETPYDHTVNYTLKAFADGHPAYSDAYIYVYTNSFRYVGRLISSQNHCKNMADKLANAGQFSSAKAAGFSTDTNSWEGLFDHWWYWISGENPNIIECEDDAGEHGENGTSNKKYAVNSNSKWTNASNSKISWGGYTSYDFFSANYQNWFKYYRVAAAQTRLDVMRNVIKNLVNSTTGINIGLMSFNTDNLGTQGGRVTTPLGYIEDNRTAFNTDLDSLDALTWTPIAETLFESLRYYSGGKKFLGSQSVDASQTSAGSGIYKSPITDECQPNNVILLTDGEPTYDADPSSGWHDGENDVITRNEIEKTVGTCSGNCLDEIAKYMYESDIHSTLKGEQSVTTYTIGLDLKSDLLRLTAEGTDEHAGGGGKYYEASNTTELESAIKQIFSSLKDISTTFVSPGVAVNTFNRLNHRDELYFSVFKPESGPVWKGNLKRYRLGSDGVVYDLKGRTAIDPETGFFKSRTEDGNDPGSWSWWSDEIDANDIHLGGAAENLPDNDSDRRLYTYTGSSNSLTDASNAISYANASSITKDMLGYPDATDAEHERLLNWIRGKDVFDLNGNSSTDDTRHQIMDPLHSPPVVVIYGGTDDNPDTTVFLGDNQGFLHAFNASNNDSSTYSEGGGEEHFAFMPKELLANQKDLMENSKAVSHIYGMDGAISVWTHDDNNDLDLYDTNDFVYLYSGMRRGGNSYYALDVSDRNSPSFLWQITGGVGGTSGFEELGQTWSKPVKTKVRMGSNVRDVLIFGGGYDTRQDTSSTKTTDTIGRAVYIVDAETGKKIWSASPSNFSQMQYSIPSNIKAIDVNADGIADQMYVGDMGGQVWRFDIDNENSSTNTLYVHGGVIASLSGTTAEENRRFYHAPDVSVLNDNGTVSLAIIIGSGWQAHPLDKVVVDRIYMLKSSDVLEPPINENLEIEYVTLTEADLYDATENHLGDVSADNTLAEQEAAYKEYYGYTDPVTDVIIPPKEGWYIRFTRPGEKMLATSLTIDGQVYFTTYEPTPNTTGCIYSAGIPRLYHISVSDATPVKNYDGIGLSTELTVPDREVGRLTTQSLPTSPQRLRVDGKDQLCIGTECESLNREETIIKTYWAQEE